MATGFIPPVPLAIFFDDVYLGKQPVAWKEYYKEQFEVLENSRGKTPET